MIPYRKSLKQIARTLRSTMADSEQVLWSKLRGKQLRGIQFYRQKPIGDAIVDFYAPKAKLVIEIDGSQHMTAENIHKDQRRSMALHHQGLRVLRFTNLQVLKELDSVVEAIFQALLDRTNPPKPPLPKGAKNIRHLIKIIGLGNLFRGDDAIGNLVARELHHYQNPTTSIIEGGLTGLQLLDEMEGIHTLILIDGVFSHSPKGTIHRLIVPRDMGKIRQLAWSTSGTSTHDFGLGEALTLADTLGVLPPHLVIYGIEIGTVETGAPVSPTVAQALHTVANRIATEELHLSHA